MKVIILICAALLLSGCLPTSPQEYYNTSAKLIQSDNNISHFQQSMKTPNIFYIRKTDGSVWEYIIQWDKIYSTTPLLSAPKTNNLEK